MKKSLLTNVTAMMIGTTLIAAAATQAVPIEPSDFGPAVVYESFEGLSPGTNLPAVGNGAFLRPAVTSPYAFSSGVILTGPVPNSLEGEGPTIGDFALGDASVYLPSGDITSPADVPFGSAYMISGGDSRDVSAEFTFGADMLRVGAYLGGSVESLTIALFDSADVLLKETHLLGAMTDWDTNFIGFEHPAGIRRMTIDFGPYSTGTPGPQHLLIDQLMFEQIPEPATAILLALGSLVLLKESRRIRCSKERRLR